MNPKTSPLFRYLVFVLWVLTITGRTCLAEFIVHTGPASIGNGGPNPLSIPPTNPLDYEFIWRTSSSNEWRFSIVPGIFFGNQIYQGGPYYISLGSGLIVSGLGGSFGLYTAVGYEACYFLCFNLEYMKTLGLAPQVIQPYAIRFGIVLGR